ncbi:4-(cytidine 5'-diphospho)-2-C-methyl-D-erythritol kinase [Tepidimonas taiwanensis]|uniref:4-diphosphocytidyl-2-C-methyl-D-erythritol kinase n=1 Tax=Tepidimonas taiwanensis TaxID=307486 RepID=A0A554X140_9BURK|nr:4-(cytidine 5'-diphospho)-2-C-methyl-D-erythritol kinase [Tepidimonas taiwanensis]MDM7463337.1 4-(cytidine 5'-diphospho)-2-C-methyl-D-erythritol kinase [Tepidimonas taiwanensis]TSE29466.1 4-diphosphocytidyl-2-C-methyl-D-erythritol kinase [Tepidimonas taiwanensis]UBQ05866.1 4-(cytidine 5'-diphospho)-2-C-methyl-D-erythritol kinase [Tepidimonas taiwanensis]
MNALLDVPAPAKLNRFLHVTGRRADGYHELQSVFQLIDWCDTLHFETRRDGRLSREDLRGADGDTPPLPADDLCLRAARALQSASGCPLGVHIVLDKRIPQQAGLGGGSSDAASTLIALNRLWGLHWPRSALMAIGERLGADVPFFLGGRNAWVEGIGERLKPLDLPPARFLVVKPAAGVPTAAIFQAHDLERATPPAIMADFVAHLHDCPRQPWGRNDLQPVAVRLCPDIARALERLADRGLAARMTGSGSAVFAVLPERYAPEDDLFRGWPDGWQVRVCCGLPEHPLIGWQKDAIM